jgi:hypothetical protein
MQKERFVLSENLGSIYTPGHEQKERVVIGGRFHFTYREKGKIVWQSSLKNTVMDVGANYALDQIFGGAQNTAYFMGLISSVGYTGIPVVGDTMASHASANHVWVEAGNGSNFPLWSTPAADARATLTWAAAGTRSKALSAAAAFTFAGTGGTVKGAFIVTGPSAVATNNNTGGTLFCAGVFSGGDQVVSVGGTLSVSYSLSA